MKAPSELLSGFRLLSVYPTLSGVISTFLRASITPGEFPPFEGLLFPRHFLLLLKFRAVVSQI